MMMVMNIYNGGSNHDANYDSEGIDNDDDVNDDSYIIVRMRMIIIIMMMTIEYEYLAKDQERAVIYINHQ